MDGTRQQGDAKWLVNDTDFDSLRDIPRFKRLIALTE